jgi:hypothetical protein
MELYVWFVLLLFIYPYSVKETNFESLSDIREMW